MEFQHSPGRIFALDGDGKLIAEVTFPAEGGVADIDHTFVDASLRGQGVAGKLLAAAAEQIRAEGLKAKATCSYAVKWFDQHPEEQDLLV
jgi:predicted GNAT family acetyltransferase